MELPTSCDIHNFATADREDQDLKHLAWFLVASIVAPLDGGGVRHLSLIGCAGLTRLARLPALHSVSVYRCGALRDLSPLAVARALETDLWRARSMARRVGTRPQCGHSRA